MLATKAEKFIWSSTGKLFKSGREKPRKMSAKKIYSKEYKEYREAHVEAKKNPIMAAVKFDQRRQLQGETFDSFVTTIWNSWPGVWT